MTVKELIKRLQEMPQDMDVIVDLHSDYTEVVGVEVINVLGKHGGCNFTNYYPTQHKKEPANLIDVVYIG